MRKVIVNTFVSLDGVMQAPGGPEEDPSGGFTLGGWTFPHFDDAVGAFIGEGMAEPFELLLGRGTYEIFAAYWPHSDGGPAEPFNAAVKHVASTTLTELSWENSRLIEGDVPAGIAALKDEDGPPLQVHGSAGLIQTLLAHDLVDELNLVVYPVTLGGGKRLFGDGTAPAAFRLRSASSSPSGAVLLRYERAGAVETGSFASDEPSEAEVARREAMRAAG